MSPQGFLILLVSALVPGAFAPGTAGPVEPEGPKAPLRGVIADLPFACAVPAEPPEYYAIDLVPTRQVTGTGQSRGVAHLTFDTSPFGVSLAPDGSYRTTLHVRVDRLPARRQGDFVAWATTPEIDRVVRIGVLDDEGFTEGAVEWNKFLVVVTLEPEGPAEAGSQTEADPGPGAGAGAPAGPVAGASSERWTGPIVLRGMSRSGRMHTMAGHGPFEQLECAAFGY